MRENHILIIDDDLMLLKTAEEILSDQYNVSVAKSGIQALNLLNKNIIPDLILLDIDMPQMDGYETLEEIKKIPRCELIPIIFLTGFSEMDYEVRGLKAGAVDYIVKTTFCTTNSAASPTPTPWRCWKNTTMNLSTPSTGAATCRPNTSAS